jgi:hypothetical protein
MNASSIACSSRKWRAASAKNSGRTPSGSTMRRGPCVRDPSSRMISSCVTVLCSPKFAKIAARPFCSAQRATSRVIGFSAGFIAAIGTSMPHACEKLNLASRSARYASVTRPPHE